MEKYHKIQTIFKRDPNNKFKTLLIGEYSLPEFEFLKDNIWVYTEKVNGTNMRIIFDGEKLTFKGKTDNAQIPSFLINKLNETILPKLNLFKEKFGDTIVTLYGEGYGAKIEKGGGNYRPDQDFVLFDVKIGSYWLQRKDVEDIGNSLFIDVVPIIGKGTLYDMIEIVRSGFKSQWGDFIAEGIVARPETELFTNGGKRIITKLKYKDFPH